MGTSTAAKTTGAALIATLVIVAIGLSLRPPEDAGEAPASEPRPEAVTQSPEPAPALIPLPDDSTAADEEATTAAPNPEPDAPQVEGIALLADGRPLPGVIVKSAGETLTISGLDGTFLLPLEAAELTVAHPEAIPSEVDGGAVDAEGRLTVTATRLRIVFSDRPGRAHVRFVNARTGAPIPDLTGLRIRWSYESVENTTIEGRMRYDRDSGAGGWISLPESDFPFDMFPMPPPGESVSIEFTLPGYTTAHVPVAHLVGRAEVTVEPVPPDARAVIRIPEKLRSARIRAAVRSLDPDGPAVPDHLLDVPVRDGRLLLYGLPDGRFAVEVSAEVDGQTIRAGAEFERAGGTAEIGEIRLTTWAGIRARVTDLDGSLPPQARVIIVREGEDVESGRELEPDEEGYVCLRDFEPGVPHVVAALGLPGPLRQIVNAPEEPGRVATVELRWPDRLVPCRIRFSRNGKIVAPEACLLDGPIRGKRLRWSEDGKTLITDLLPGEYEFSMAGSEDLEGALLWHARLRVSPAPSLEETLALVPGDD